jgi:ketopantoate reductase
MSKTIEMELKMKILVIGAGVIGTVYAWQLSEAGQEVSVLVRKGKKERLVEDGFCIRYDVLSEGKRLKAQMPHLAGFEKYFS